MDKQTQTLLDIQELLDKSLPDENDVKAQIVRYTVKNLRGVAQESDEDHLLAGGYVDESTVGKINTHINALLAIIAECEENKEAAENEPDWDKGWRAYETGQLLPDFGVSREWRKGWLDASDLAQYEFSVAHPNED